MNRQRLVTAITCLVAWAALALSGKTPIEPLVEVLKAIVTGVFTYHMALKDPKE